MKKNAFTLVELLAVLIVLGIILSLIITNVFGILEESKKEAYDKQVELLKSSTKEYVSDNKRELFSDQDTICVSIYTLKQYHYIEQIPENPTKSGEKMSESFGFVVQRDDTTEKITYSPVEDITSESACNN